MAKHVQISEELFVQLTKYFIFESEADVELIKKELSDKVEAMIRRDLYGKAATGDEDARREYLDRAGISKSFRR